MSLSTPPALSRVWGCLCWRGQQCTEPGPACLVPPARARGQSILVPLFALGEPFSCCHVNHPFALHTLIQDKKYSGTTTRCLKTGPIFFAVNLTCKNQNAFSPSELITNQGNGTKQREVPGTRGTSCVWWAGDNSFVCSKKRSSIAATNQLPCDGAKGSWATWQPWNQLQGKSHRTPTELQCTAAEPAAPRWSQPCWQEALHTHF